MLAAALIAQEVILLPTKPIDVGLLVTPSGKKLSALATTNKATVFFIITADCPIANRYAPEIQRIYQKYKAAGIGFFRVYLQYDRPSRSEPTQHGKEFGLTMPALLDPKLKFVRGTGCRMTPEVVVLSKSRMVLYRGRIDDENVDHGAVRTDYRRDLRVALDEILNGKPVSVKLTPPTGCFIAYPLNR
jgi:hypothetical protein